MKEIFPSKILQKYFPFKIYHEYNFPKNITPDMLTYNKISKLDKYQLIELLDYLSYHDSDIKDIMIKSNLKTVGGVYSILFGIISKYLPEDIIWFSKNDIQWKLLRNEYKHKYEYVINKLDDKKYIGGWLPSPITLNRMYEYLKFLGD